MSRATVVVSDLSNAIVPEGDEVTITVKWFPGVEELPVRLDAGLSEIKSLTASTDDYVIVEIGRGEEVKQVVIDLATFTSMFKGDPYAALMNGTRIRAARSTGGTSSNKGELAAIREWATANGYEVNAKGRIKQNIVDAYRAANVAA